LPKGSGFSAPLPQYQTAGSGLSRPAAEIFSGGLKIHPLTPGRIDIFLHLSINDQYRNDQYRNDQLRNVQARNDQARNDQARFGGDRKISNNHTAVRFIRRWTRSAKLEAENYYGGLFGTEAG
jgi:hypothetical protein